MKNKSDFKLRTFVSITMFIFVIILIITGITLEVMEEVSENYESIEVIPSYLISILHFTTALHVLAGLSFGILSLFHIILNWKTLRSYFTKKQAHVSIEVILSFILTAIIIIIALSVAMFVF